MRRLCLLASVAAAAIAVTLFACSNDDGRTAFEGEEGGVPPGSGDGGSVDSGGDAADTRGPFDPADVAVVCEATPCITQLVAGAYHFCARASDGSVRCWGDGAKGQLGGAPDAGADAGLALTSVSQISAAGETSCARTDDGAVHCWGGNQHGELGGAAADEDSHPVPVRVAIGGAASRVDVGHGVVCATASDGRVTCWGDNENAQLARGAASAPGDPPNGPGPAELGVPAKRTAAGTATAFALTDDGALISWGALDGVSGVLGGRTSSIAITATPAPVDGLGPVSSFSVSAEVLTLFIPEFGIPPTTQHACAVSKGEVYCWGRSERGAFGSGLPEVLVPLPRHARLATRAYAQQVAAGGENTCVRMTDGEVRCTGANDRGQLGTGAPGAPSVSFVKATSFVGRAVHVAVANETVCALLEGGTVQCWGGNARGELGQGRRDDEAHPSATKVAFQ